MADHDTSDIQQELDTAVQEARAVLARMDEVKHRFDAVAAEVDAAKHSFNEAKNQIDQRVGNTAQHVDAFVKHAQEVEGHVDADFTKAYNHAVEQVWRKITSAYVDFQHNMDTVYGAVDKSHTVLQQLTDTAKQADHDTADGLHNSIHTLQDSMAQLQQQFDGTTHPAMATLDDQLAHLHQQSEATSQEGHDHITEAMHAVDDHIQQGLLDPVAQHVQEHTERANRIAHDDVDATLQQLTQDGRDKLENELKQKITQLFDKISQDIDQVTEQIQHAGEGTSGPREEMKVVQDALHGVTQLFEPATHAIRKVAAVVGVDC